MTDPREQSRLTYELGRAVGLAEAMRAALSTSRPALASEIGSFCRQMESEVMNGQAELAHLQRDLAVEQLAEFRVRAQLELAPAEVRHG